MKGRPPSIRDLKCTPCRCSHPRRNRSAGDLHGWKSFLAQPWAPWHKRVAVWNGDRDRGGGHAGCRRGLLHRKGGIHEEELRT